MELKEGYKKTDIGLIPNDWEIAKFKDITKVITCGLAATPTYVDESIGRPFLSAQNVRDGRVVYDKYKFISKELYNLITKHNPPEKGDLLYTRVGAGIGEAGVIETEMKFGIYVSLTLIKVKSKKLYNYYLLQQLNSPKFKTLAKNGQFAGGGVQNLNVQVVRDFLIPLPSLPEQQAIAEVLSDTDNLIQSLERQIDKKRQIKQGAMQKLLSPKVGWEEKKLGDIFEISGGFSATREQLSDDGYCYLHYGDIHGSTKTYIDCEQDYSNIPKLKIELTKISKKSLLKNGDIVFVDASEDEDGTSRHLVIRNKYNLPFISGLHTIVAKSKTDSLDLKFKNYCFQSNYIKEQFRFYAVGTKVSGVSKTSIKNIKIYIPPIAEQKNIAILLESMDIEISKLEQKNSKYKQLKQGLMQNLLTGKIRLV